MNSINLMNTNQYSEPEDIIMSPAQMAESTAAFKHAMSTDADKNVCAKIAFRLGHSMKNMGRLTGDRDMADHGDQIVRRWRTIMDGNAPWPVPR